MHADRLPLTVPRAGRRSRMSGRLVLVVSSTVRSSVAARVNMFLEVFFTTTTSTTLHNSCVYHRIDSMLIAQASNVEIYHRHIPSRSSFNETTPPQRLRDCIHWTPQCSSRTRPANQTAHAPSQAITPSRSFLASDHLQTADQSTYPLPIPLHITMSPAVTLCISPGSSQSG